MIAITSSASRSRPPQSQVIDLTIDHIDLTALDDSPPNSPQPYSPSIGEPPRKRQRVADGPLLQGCSRDLGACLKAQVKPYIDAYLAEIPAGQVNVTAIGRKVLFNLGNVRDFSIEFTHNKGFLSQSLEETLAEKARQQIVHYASQPEFQLNPDTTVCPTPFTSQRTPSIPSRAIQCPTPHPVTPSGTVPHISLTPLSTLPGNTTDIQGHGPPEEQPPIPSNHQKKAQPKPWTSWKTQTRQSVPPTARQKVRNAWLHMPRRPYITTEDRQQIIRGTPLLNCTKYASSGQEPLPFHVDFTPDEMEALRRSIREACGKKAKSKRGVETAKELGRLLRKQPGLLTVIPKEVELKGGLVKRDHVAIRNLLDEMVDRHKRPSRVPKVLTLEADEVNKPDESHLSSHIPSLLFAREIDGNRGFGRMRRLVNFTNEFRKAHEDDLKIQAEWVNCAGDIMTISWTSNKSFVCGTTTHSDSHNQQYNRDGNLLLCSSLSKELRAFPNHRIPRPIVSEGDNSTEAMRESQSPWLYSSVVSSDYDVANDRAYTSSFDKTVKVWKVDRTGKDMTVLGTWQHTGNVNFVTASKHESSMVATAADVPNHAVRVYNVDSGDISESVYRAYSGSRAWNEGEEQKDITQKWAYFPATMQWGLAKGFRHLLLVGYSPRSLTDDDNDIPDDKKNTGEICLWDCLTGQRIKVMTAATQNVFEVAWHPDQPAFIVATSPAGLVIPPRTRTQIRVFRPTTTPDGEEAFGEIQCLECPAIDINELTIKPNSIIYSYVTAACTDGKVYVWDTARGDKPIHTLAHGDPIEEFYEEISGGEREEADVGVKFMAWGTTADRFYTGSSDGVVKVWNVRNMRNPLVRNLFEAPGCISCGSFSPDFSKLAVGDASGRVTLLSLENEADPPANLNRPLAPPGFNLRSSQSLRRPQPFLRHDEPPPPGSMRLRETGVGIGKRFLSSGQLVRHHNPTIGVVQGPAYSTLGLHRDDLHFDSDPSKPLLARTEEEQQENQKMFRSPLKVNRLRTPADLGSATLVGQHAGNLTMDLDLEQLDEVTKVELFVAQVCIDDPIHYQGWDFDYEEE